MVPFRLTFVRFAASCHTCQFESNGMLLKFKNTVNSFGSLLTRLPSSVSSVWAWLAPASPFAASVPLVSLFAEQPASVPVSITAAIAAAISLLFFISEIPPFCCNCYDKLTLHSSNGDAGLKVFLHKRKYD